MASKVIQNIAFTIMMLAMAISFLVLGVFSAKAESNNCEYLAKEFQKENFGSLIFIQPLKQNGAYDFGEYNGHFLNHAKGIYFDSQSGKTMYSIDEVQTWYNQMTGKKSEIWDLAIERPPFPLIWHY
jgi:hypothetical protein